MIPCCIKRSVAATYIIYVAESAMSQIRNFNYSCKLKKMYENKTPISGNNTSLSKQIT